MLRSKTEKPIEYGFAPSCTFYMFAVVVTLHGRVPPVCAEQVRLVISFYHDYAAAAERVERAVGHSADVGHYRDARGMVAHHVPEARLILRRVFDTISS